MTRGSLRGLKVSHREKPKSWGSDSSESLSSVNSTLKVPQKVDTKAYLYLLALKYLGNRPVSLGAQGTVERTATHEVIWQSTFRAALCAGREFLGAFRSASTQCSTLMADGVCPKYFSVDWSRCDASSIPSSPQKRPCQHFGRPSR